MCGSAAAVPNIKGELIPKGYLVKFVPDSVKDLIPANFGIPC